jgi:tetratricopeptide (TPR) repeat protein/DNA-binding SARP family transcriptional activator
VSTTFGILGRTALLIDGDLRQSWGRPKERALLGALLVHAGRWVSADTLIRWTWPDEAPAPQAPTLHHYATNIRKWLRQMPAMPTLHAEKGGYCLEVDKSLIDYNEFGRLVSEARGRAGQHDYGRAAELATQALSLWRGIPLEDLDGEPARAWRIRVEHDDWLPANLLLLDALLELERHEEVLARLADLQTDRPLDATLATRRMSALHGRVRSAEAMSYYIAVRRQLLADGDDQAADYVRQHRERLLAGAQQPAGAPSREPIGPPRQLRHDLADFVGRTDLLAAIDEATANTAGSVVILDGMPGVGKTALAVHWAHRARSRFPDGDFFIDLNGFSDNARIEPPTVVDEFLVALGHPPDNIMNRRARELLLSRLLANRRVVVILDNARDSAHVKDIVDLLPGAVVIITSRQRMTKLATSTGAHQVRVEPMNEDVAAELLSVRLRRRRRLDRVDHARVVRLCGGLPLAISVLAEHVATVPAAQLPEFAQQLSHRQLILEIGDDGDVPANTSAFFAQSYQALPPVERRLFRVLGLHPGPDFGLDAACACAARPRAETAKSLRALLGAHLIEQPHELDRYRFHDLIREFARHRAETDESETERVAADRRIVSFYLALATEADRVLYPSNIPTAPLAVEAGVTPVTPGSPTEAKNMFARERRNLIAVTRYAAAQGLHSHVWRLADVMCTYLDRHGHYEASIDVRQLAVRSARDGGDRLGEATSLVALGMVHKIVGEHAAALRSLESARRIVDDLGHKRGQSSVLFHLAALEMHRGNTAAALDLYRRCLDLARETALDEVLTWTHCGLGAALRTTEQHDEALEHLREAKSFAIRAEDQSALSAALMETAAVYRDLGDLAAASTHCVQALDIADSIPDLELTAQICTTLAAISKDRREPNNAMAYARQAVDLCRNTRNLIGEADARNVLGDIEFANGDPEEAALDWQQSAQLYEYVGNIPLSTAVRTKLGNIPVGGIQLPTVRPHNARDENTPSSHKG